MAGKTFAATFSFRYIQIMTLRIDTVYPFFFPGFFLIAQIERMYNAPIYLHLSEFYVP